MFLLDDSCSMSRQFLELYRAPSDWNRGSFILRATWLLLGKPLCSSSLPGTSWRRYILKFYGAKFGVGGRIKPGVRITSPWKLEVGDHCWLGEDLWIDNLDEVVIGSNVCLSQGAYLCTGNHDFRRPGFDLRLGRIIVGSEAWIAAKAVLAPGITVGSGAVVSLGSVVLFDVPQDAIVRGNPAKVVGER